MKPLKICSALESSSPSIIPLQLGMIASELVGKIDLLPDFPNIGTPVEMAPDSVRDMVFGKYVIRYSVHTSVIIILRVWHELEGER